MALSPMMKHYFVIKEQYKDCLVFFRLGDFYEMFFDDAITASRELDLTLTGRDCGLEERAPMCGVPHHAVDNYIAKLIAKNYKVAICEQLTTPEESKGMVERGVVRVITPGTVMEDNILDEKRNNYLSCLVGNEKEYSLAWIDISTGEFYVFEAGYKCVNDIEDMLIAVAPSEIIVNDYFKNREGDFNSIRLEKLPHFYKYTNYSFDYNQAKDSIHELFHCQNLDAFGLRDKKYAVSSCGALINYVKETQKRILTSINAIHYVYNDKYLFLDYNARRNLEILENSKDGGRKATLLDVLDNTKTSMGSRNLRKWLEQPIRDNVQINQRLDAVEELINSPKIRLALFDALSGIRDVERITSRIAYGNCSPRDFGAIRASLSKISPIKNLLNNCKSTFISRLNENIFEMKETYDMLVSAIKDEDLPLNLKDGNFIKDGYDTLLDDFRLAKTNGKEWLANLETREKEVTGIKTLKVGYNRVFGYYIEITKSQIDKVPFNYVRKQTLAGGERYITEELKEIEEKLEGAETNALKLEHKIFEEIKLELIKVIPYLQSTARNIAILDTILSFAITSIKYNYTKPVINDNIKCINIKNGRHPVVETFLKNQEFVPNDSELDCEDNRTMIITGPNMSGKSTYMRQVALITFMAHLGCFVPADYAEISITDRIFTRIGASDDLAYGQSTFMVEMVEVATILANATNNSLLILDEIGRGTSTFDGLSIAKAVLEDITENIHCKTLFATHYHELTELEGHINGIKNYKILATEVNKGVIFLHKIQKGGTNKSFGIEVAQLAGFPKRVISRAKAVSSQLEKSPLTLLNNEQSLAEVASDNVKENVIVDKLKAIDIENLTPLKAFELLYNLVEEAKSNG